MMVRPTKHRAVEFFPEDDYFAPCKKMKCRAKSEVEEIILKIEELEAMRLKDIENLSQEECAEKMQISRPTFQNIINNARKKVAMALIEGKAIKISGGNYIRKSCKYKCFDCGSNYEVNSSEDKFNCPNCKSEKVACLKKMDTCKKCCEETI